MNSLDFTVFPILETERLLLRQLDVSDSQQLFALRSNEEVNKYIDRPPPNSMEDIYSFITRITDGIRAKSSMYWVISLKDKPGLLGTICLWNFQPEEDKIELGYELLPEFQGKGYMKEALEAVINYTFDGLKIRTLEGWPREDNISSIRILEKTGFTRDLESEAKENKKSALDRMQIYSIKR